MNVIPATDACRWLTATLAAWVGLLAAAPALAGLYTCINEKQQLVFTNVPKGERCQAIEDMPRGSLARLNGSGGAGRGLSSKQFLLDDLGNVWTGKRRRSSKDEAMFDHLITDAAGRHQLDPLLIKAVIRAESDFDPAACSRSGARGLMQLMPGTARDMRVHNVHDPRQNIDGGARYLRVLLDTFAQDLPLSLAAYNAGPERVLDAKGIPPIAETRQYVRRVLQLYREYSASRPKAPPAQNGQTLRLHRLVLEK